MSEERRARLQKRAEAMAGLLDIITEAEDNLRQRMNWLEKNEPEVMNEYSVQSEVYHLQDFRHRVQRDYRALQAALRHDSSEYLNWLHEGEEK